MSHFGLYEFGRPVGRRALIEHSEPAARTSEPEGTASLTPKVEPSAEELALMKRRSPRPLLVLAAVAGLVLWFVVQRLTEIDLLIEMGGRH